MLVACTGCTPAQAWSDWDVPSILAQQKYWLQHPPLSIMVEQYLGFKPSVVARSAIQGEAANEAAMHELAQFAQPMPETMLNHKLNPYSRKRPAHVG
ncbi:MAG: hypothetical protein AB3X44_16310 [Leptothrix sp. (in: b-proteobacteria)]